MANTFFGFDTSANNGDNLLPDEDDCIENEEEYDALNDETFGALEDNSFFDDWEQQHEQFAEAVECNKHDEEIENSISKLMLDDDRAPIPFKNSVWAYTPPQNGDGPFNILNTLQKASKSFIEAHQEPPRHQSKPFRTVEELEANLLKSPVPPVKNNPFSQFSHPQPPPHFRPPLPPGFNINPHRPPLPPNLPPNLPPGLLNHFFMHQQPPPPRHPLLFPSNFAPPPYYNFPPPQRHPLPHPPPRPLPQPNHLPPPYQQQQQQRQRNDSFSSTGSTRQNSDEYAGLMTSREKQWLLNIQMLQLNTGTPYFDDYYYTVFKERKTRITKEYLEQKANRFGNRRGNERNDNNNTLTPRVYTPLQFENSLGKLQCGSVTAPRKIIDMDIVQPEKDADEPKSQRDTRKIKQLLLELESLFTLLLKAEDLRNPLALSNMDKLREIKQKQRLRELELAPTSEAKQEVLKLLKQDSEQPIVENQYDYIVKIAGGLMQDDKFVSFLNIRKGKQLVLRLLPHLCLDQFGGVLLDLWQRILLCLPIVGRRDSTGDQILQKLTPFFKRFVQMCTMDDVLSIVNGLIEVVKMENSRSTPLSHQGKAPLYFILLHKFGVSALVILLIRTEYLISSGVVKAEQQTAWSCFLQNLADLCENIGSKIAQPLEPIPKQIFLKHSNRVGLSSDKRRLLETYFVDLN